MSQYDMATRAQVLALKNHGVADADIEAEIGVPVTQIQSIYTTAVERGLTSQTRIINARYATAPITLGSLPVELHLLIVGFLPLTSLIKMRGASRYWRNLITDNEDNSPVLYPQRRALLRLYDDIISAPWFIPSRAHILPHLQRFDYFYRDEFINCLPSEKVPVDFELWIREWPAKAVIGWVWPGLDRVPPEDKKNRPQTWWRSDGVNTLGIRRLPPATAATSHPLRNERSESRLSEPKCYFALQDGDLRLIRTQDGWAELTQSFGENFVAAPAVAVWRDNDTDVRDTPKLIMLIFEGGGPFNGTIVDAELGFGDVDGTFYIFQEGEFSQPYCDNWVEWLRMEMADIGQRYREYLKEHVQGNGSDGLRE